MKEGGGMSTNSECHVVKSDQTYFYFRRDENQLALSKRQGKQVVVGFFLRINVKDQKTQAIQTNIEKEELQEAQSKGRKLTDL